MDQGDVLTVQVDGHKRHRLADGNSQLVRVNREEEGSGVDPILVNPAHIAWADGDIDEADDE
jgi:ribosomal protein L16 Arg81 hydroxylase